MEGGEVAAPGVVVQARPCTGATDTPAAFRPARAKAPVIVFLHGGRWKYGSRLDYRVLDDGLTERGWVVVVPDHRKHPRVDYPAWVEDGAEAVRWTRYHIARFGGDSTRIFVIGHSSGAHTAALLALDSQHLEAVGVDPRIIRVT